MKEFHKLKNRKNKATDEPIWKKRRREEERLARKSKLWIAVVVLLISGAFALMIYGVVKSLNTSKTSTGKNEPKRAIAQVIDKVVEQNTGKIERFVVFRVDGIVLRKSVDQATFDSIEKGKSYLVTYEVDGIGRPKEIRGWVDFIDRPNRSKEPGPKPE